MTKIAPTPLYAALIFALAAGLGPARASGGVPLGGRIHIAEAEHRGVKGLIVSFVVRQPRARVYALLNDLAAFPKIFPKVRKLEVVRTKGASRDVYFEVDAVLSTASYTLRRTARRHKGYDEIRWRRLSGSARVIRGSWILRDGPRPNVTRLTYRSFVDAAAFVPTALVRSIAKRSVKDMVARLRTACSTRRRSALGGAAKASP